MIFVFILIDDFVCRLRRSEFVIPDGLKFIFCVKLMAFFRSRITAVEKAFVTEPRTAAILDPCQMIVERLLGCDIQNIKIVPIGTAFRNAINNLFAL